MQIAEMLLGNYSAQRAEQNGKASGDAPTSVLSFDSFLQSKTDTNQMNRDGLSEQTSGEEWFSILDGIVREAEYLQAEKERFPLKSDESRMHIIQEVDSLQTLKQGEVPVDKRANIKQYVRAHYEQITTIDQEGEQFLSVLETDEQLREAIPVITDMLERRKHSERAIAKILAVEENQETLRELLRAEWGHPVISPLTLPEVLREDRNISHKTSLLLKELLPKQAIEETGQSIDQKRWNEIVHLDQSERAPTQKVVELLKNHINREKTGEMARNESLPFTMPFSHVRQVTEAIRPETIKQETDEWKEILPKQNDSSTANHVLIPEQMNELYREANQLFSQLTDGDSIAKTAPDVLHLLKQWVRLEGQTEKSFPAKTMRLNDTEFGRLWSNLVTTYKDTVSMVKAETSVTANDVSNWLEVMQQTGNEKAELQTFSQQLPVSKLEQYVIHLQQGQPASQTEQSFIQQFENIIQSSRLITQPNGNATLSIQLNPANLGQMLVKLTEVDGEMLVKILVTSGKTKQMLESNMHQLKHLFSPHQVTIEKQDADTIRAEMQAEQENDEHAEEKEDHPEQQKRESDDDQTNSHFIEFFQQSLLNEEV